MKPRKQSILHTVTYSLEGRERTVQITRSRRLTHTGVERILRRTHKNAIVVRVEAMIDAR